MMASSSVSFFPPGRWAQIKLLLLAANKHCHATIKESASLTTAIGSENYFTQMEIDNMRDLIYGEAKELDPEKYGKTIPEEAIGSPRYLDLAAKHIQKHALGNCGEFAIIALNYVLKRFQAEFKDTLIHVITAVTSSDPQNHLYFHLECKASGKRLFWDPTTEEMDECDRKPTPENPAPPKIGNVFVPGRKGEKNHYISFDAEEGPPPRLLTTIDPATFQFPRPAPVTPKPKPSKCVIM